MRRLLLIAVLASCDGKTYSSAMQGNASCVVHDPHGTHCNEYTWHDPSGRNQLAATCIGPESRFDDDARCPEDAQVGVCKLDTVSTYIYSDYDDAAVTQFTSDCKTNGGEYEDAGGCAATRGGALGMALVVLAAVCVRRRGR